VTMTNELDIELNRLLESLSMASEKMSDVLKMEHEYLTKYNREGLLTIIDEKKQLGQLTETQTRTLHKHLTQKGVANGVYGLKKHLKSLTGSDDDQLLTLWLNIESLIEKNKTYNERNGAIVELNRKHAQRSLDVLRGQTGSPVSETYGADGYTQKEKNTRNISIV